MAASFTLVTGDDDYLVEREARARFEKMTAGVTDDMSKEVIDASCTKVSDTEDTLRHDRAFERLQTMTRSSALTRQYVWIKNFNWIADSQLGKAEGTKAVVERLLEVLKTIEPDGVELLISAYPLDGRKREAKLLKELGETVELKAGKDEGAMAESLVKEARGLGVSLDIDAAATLVRKVNGSRRMMESELRKLACYTGENGKIEARTVVEMVPAPSAKAISSNRSRPSSRATCRGRSTRSAAIFIRTTNRVRSVRLPRCKAAARLLIQLRAR